MKKGDDRNTIAGVNHAIKIEDGIEILNGIFSKIVYDDLPMGIEWLEHLDSLKAVRVNNFGRLKKLEQFYPEHLSGYTDVGIKKDSDVYNQSIDILNNANIPLDVFCRS